MQTHTHQINRHLLYRKCYILMAINIFCSRRSHKHMQPCNADAIRGKASVDGKLLWAWLTDDVW